MAHQVSRLSSRTSTTPSEWLSTCSQIGTLVNSWSGRSDLAVYAGTDAGFGHYACLVVDTAEVEINLEKCFGSATTPAQVGDFTERATLYDWAEPTGVIYHEALHAKHSLWNRADLEAMGEKVFTTFQLLDEARIERRGVIEKPENQVFLRSSALGLALSDLDEVSIASLSDVRACAYVAGLALARVDAGVVKFSDVVSTYEQVVEVMGEELFSKFRAIWVEFQKLETSQIARGTELAIAWNELLKEADPDGEEGEGEGGSGEGEEGEGENKSKRGGTGSSIGGKLKDALGEDADNSRIDQQKSLDDQQIKEDNKNSLDKTKSESKRKQDAERQASKTFSASTSAGESGSSSRLRETRKPTGKERASAVLIAKMLEKAKYRERSVTEVKTHAPQGRLNTRVAIQNTALKARGVMATQPAWRHTTRKHTDDPTLTIGVMVDISGSMGGAMEAMATTAWVLSEAGRRVQARTAMVYFGSGVFPTLKVGQHLTEVNVYSAPDGTEKFDEAFLAIDGALGLTYTSGVRILVVVSDGHFTGHQAEATKKAVAECKRNGVAVLWIVPEGCGNGAKYLVENNGVVLNQLNTDEIALSIGKSATDALNKIAVGG